MESGALSVLRQLEEQADQLRASIASKARTDSIEDLRYSAGLYDGLCRAITLIDRSFNKEIDGKRQTVS